jgi:hypothetical protein
MRKLVVYMDKDSSKVVACAMPDDSLISRGESALSKVSVLRKLGSLVYENGGRITSAQRMPHIILSIMVNIDSLT